LCREGTYEGSGFVAENSYNLHVDKLSIPAEELTKAKLADMLIANAHFMDEFTPDACGRSHYRPHIDNLGSRRHGHESRSRHHSHEVYRECEVR
jgi:hypothetical protein